MTLRQIALAAMLAMPCAAFGQDKSFDLNAPEPLVESGFLKHLLPRFSLKTSIRITVVESDGDAAFGADGTPVFSDGTTIWHFAKTDGPMTDKFQEWLLSDVGKRTIEAFKPDGTAMFSADVAAKAVVVETQLDGNAIEGEQLSLSLCGRCHVVNETNRMNAIGSTPSFALLRTFGDWQNRFEAFFTLKPHPAFTQIEDVTEPFDETLPSPIVPVELTLNDLDAILAYVASVEPADLGAPIQSQ